MEEYKFQETVTQPLKAGRLVWQDDNNHIQEYVLYEGISTTIGRERGNHILLSNPIVSKNHAIIQWKKGSFVITDRGSSNGTFVNRRLIHEPTPLSDSDSIEIGDYRIKFYVMEDQEVEIPGGILGTDQQIDYQKLSSEVTTQRTVPRPSQEGDADKKSTAGLPELPPQEPSRTSAPPNPVWLAAEELDEAAEELSTEEFLAGVGLQGDEAELASTEEAESQPPFLSEEDFESLIKAVEAKQAALDEEIPEPEPSQLDHETGAEVEEWIEETSPEEVETEGEGVGEETLVVETEASEEDILSWALDEEEREQLEAEQTIDEPVPEAPQPHRPSDRKKIEGAYAGLVESLKNAQENGQILRDKGLILQQKVFASIEQLQGILKEMQTLEINASEVQLDDLLSSLPNTPYDVRLLMNLADNSELLARILKDSLALGEMIEKTKHELEEALQQYSG